jgi:hypothetical protein
MFRCLVYSLAPKMKMIFLFKISIDFSPDYMVLHSENRTCLIYETFSLQKITLSKEICSTYEYPLKDVLSHKFWSQ